MSPLHIAAFGGQYEAALVLLMRHADPNAASRTGDTPLHLAAQYGHARLVRIVRVREYDVCDMDDLYVARGYVSFSKNLSIRSSDRTTYVCRRDCVSAGCPVLSPSLLNLVLRITLSTSMPLKDVMSR